MFANLWSGRTDWYIISNVYIVYNNASDGNARDQKKEQADGGTGGPGDGGRGRARKKHKKNDATRPGDCGGIFIFAHTTHATLLFALVMSWGDKHVPGTSIVHSKRGEETVGKTSAILLFLSACGINSTAAEIDLNACA